MQPQQDYKQLLSEVIKKQIVILGPDITLAKARNVPGLVIADDGAVTDIAGDPQVLTQKLIDEFVHLSGEIVKKTMEPLLKMNQASEQTSSAQPTAMMSPQTSISRPMTSSSEPSIAPMTTSIQSPNTIQQPPTPHEPSPVQTTLAQQANSVS